MTHSPIIVALDFPTANEVLEFAQTIDPKTCRLKIGFESFLTGGPALVEQLQKQGFEIFLDLKFYDIPNTTASACRVAAQLGVWMINVHASGGQQMIEAASNAIADQRQRPMLIAVTVLTSMSQSDLNQVGINHSPERQVLSLAKLAQLSGADGVVCSAQEAGAIRKACGEDFTLVTPGIRPAGSATDDQHRIMTPLDAIEAGSNYLVIGRPIIQASDPHKALNEILITLS